MTQISTIVILATGQGTHMKSKKAKVLHSFVGQILLSYAIRTVQEIKPERIVLIVRHQHDAVTAKAKQACPDIIIADQDEIPGTGRAVWCALQKLEEIGQGQEGTLVVTSADVPLMESSTVLSLVETCEDEGSALCLLTMGIANPFGYDRIQHIARQVASIVEEKDVTYAQKQIKEVNARIYAFDTEFLAEALPKLSAGNNQGEIHLTDMLRVARENGRGVSSVVLAGTAQAEGCNDRVQLAQLRAEYNRHYTRYWVLHGVAIIDPASTWTDADANIGMNTTIHPNIQLRKDTVIGEDCRIGPDFTLIDMGVGGGAEACRVHTISAEIGDKASIGPFIYLRPSIRPGPETKVGRFCETKNVEVRRDTKIPHLSYVGDATIDKTTNIGATTIFANYDGVNKHRSTVSSYYHTGTDSVFTAPAHTGDSIYTGGGTIVRHDIPASALTVNQLDMRTIPDWVVKHCPDTDAAHTVIEKIGTVDTNSLEAESTARSLTPDSNSGDKWITATSQARIKTGIEMTGLFRTPRKRLVIVSGHPHHQLAEDVAKALDTEVLPATIYGFASRETYARYDESIYGCDVFCIQSTSGDVDRWFVEQLIMVDALKRASAKRITVIAPLYPYSRRDKKHQGREPASARLMVDLYRTAGASRLMSMNMYASQEQDFSVDPVDHLMAMPVLIDYVRTRVELNRATVVSPGARRIRVAEKWTDQLGGSPLAFIHKTWDTTRPNVTAADRVAGEVKGRTCVLVDDLTDTDDTITETMGVLEAARTKDVLMAATHGVLSNPATKRLNECEAREIIVTDTVPIPAAKRFPQLVVLPITPLLTRAIRQVFEEGSITALFE